MPTTRPSWLQIKERKPHPVYGKMMTSTKKFHAHDENNEAGVGDTVTVMETRPLSKTEALASPRDRTRRPSSQRLLPHVAIDRKGLQHMIQMQSMLTVADNSGARKVQCIKVLGGSKRRYAGLGDVIICSVKEAMPERQRQEGRSRSLRHRSREEGSPSQATAATSSFDQNACRAHRRRRRTRAAPVSSVPSPVSCAIKKYMKIVSLAPETL